MKEWAVCPEPALHEVKIAQQTLKLPEEVQPLRQKQGLRAPVLILVEQVGSLQVLNKLVKTKSLLGSGAYVGQYSFDGVEFRRVRGHEFINVRRHEPRPRVAHKRELEIASQCALGALVNSQRKPAGRDVVQRMPLAGQPVKRKQPLLDAAASDLRDGTVNKLVSVAHKVLPGGPRGAEGVGRPKQVCH